MCIPLVTGLDDILALKVLVYSLDEKGLGDNAALKGHRDILLLRGPVDIPDGKVPDDTLALRGPVGNLDVEVPDDTPVLRGPVGNLDVEVPDDNAALRDRHNTQSRLSLDDILHDIL